MGANLKDRVSRLAMRLQDRGRSLAAIDPRTKAEAASDAELWATIGVTPGLVARMVDGAVTDADRADLAQRGLPSGFGTLDEFLCAVAALDAEV